VNTLTSYDAKLVAFVKRNGCIQVHRTNKLCWYRRERLLWLSERGYLKLTLPVIGSYYNFSEGKQS
jgi:hypothetical protein